MHPFVEHSAMSTIERSDGLWNSSVELIAENKIDIVFQLQEIRPEFLQHVEVTPMAYNMDTLIILSRFQNKIQSDSPYYFFNQFSATVSVT